MPTPPTTISESIGGAPSVLASGVICRPSLAHTWRPSRVRVCQRYSSLPESWLAIRSGSTAEAREIRVKLSSSRKPMDCGARFCGGTPGLKAFMMLDLLTLVTVAPEGLSYACFLPG
jgi:hypothetical protein